MAVDVDAIERITAACEAAITVLPRGGRGGEAAILWLRAFPEACRRGLGDVTDSAPALFRIFVAAGILPSCPSDSSMTGAIRLIASVSPLVTPRSLRTWTAWLGSACDPESSISATLRATVTSAMRANPRPRPTVAPRRIGSIRSERDRLAADLQAAREELELEKGKAVNRIAALVEERDHLATDLQGAREELECEKGRSATLGEDRDRLAADLQTARGELERQKGRAVDRITTLVEVRDRLAADLASATQERDCLATDLAAAAERHRGELISRDREKRKIATALAEARETLARRQREFQKAEDRHNLHAQAQTERIEALLATHAAQKIESDRRASSLADLKTALARTHEELAASEARLAHEKAAHARTSAILLTQDQSLHKLRDANKSLKHFVDAADDKMSRTLARICARLDVFLSEEAEEQVHVQMQAIFDAIEAQQSSVRTLLDRVENHLRHRARHTGVLSATIYLFEKHFQVSFDEFIKKQRDTIHEAAEVSVRKDMEKLNAIVAWAS